MKKQLPDPEGLTARLTARLTVLENRIGGLDDAVTAISADVAALGRGLAELTGQVRALTDATTGHILRTARTHNPGNGNGHGPATDGAGDQQGEGEGQPDWIRVTDPDAAAAWLTVVGEFVDEVLTRYSYTPPPPCWPLHPGVVAELLALHAQHQAVYALPDPTGVSEWLGRWRPGAVERVGGWLSSCANQRGHTHAGRLYHVEHLQLPDVAAWWADTHGENPDAVEAFTLTRIL